jgi:GDP-4-dehydro-6-deoxy-D-mannose reductase
VTGAAGFAGRHLLNLLSGEGIPVWALRRPDGLAGDSVRTRAAADDFVTWRAVDLLDRAALAAAIDEARPAAIYHCAAAAHAGESWSRVTETLEINVVGTHYLLEAIRRNGATIPVVIPGTALVYRPAEHALSEDDPVGPANPYAVSKLAQEMLGLRAALDDRIPVLLPRAFNHIGPGQDSAFATSHFAKRLAEIEAGLAEPVLEVGNLAARRDIVDVRDTVRAYRQLAERGTPGRVYNVCSGRAFSMQELLDRLMAHTTMQIDVRVDPSRFRPNDAPLMLGNPGRIREEVGWEATIPLERTLGDLLQYWRERVRAEGNRS